MVYIDDYSQRFTPAANLQPDDLFRHRKHENFGCIRFICPLYQLIYINQICTTTSMKIVNEPDKHIQCILLMPKEDHL